MTERTINGRLNCQHWIGLTALFLSETVRNSNHISTQTRLNVSEMVFCPCTYLKKKMQTRTTTEEEDTNETVLNFV